MVHTFYPHVAHSHPGDKKVSLCGGLTSCIAYVCKCLFSLLSSKPNRTLSVETSFIFRMLLHLLILVLSACFASKIPGNLVQVSFNWHLNQHQHCTAYLPIISAVAFICPHTPPIPLSLLSNLPSDINLDNI